MTIIMLALLPRGEPIEAGRRGVRRIGAIIVQGCGKRGGAGGDEVQQGQNAARAGVVN